MNLHPSIISLISQAVEGWTLYAEYPDELEVSRSLWAWGVGGKPRTLLLRTIHSEKTVKTN